MDHERLRVYLKEKYAVARAYYFPGFLNEEYQSLYTKLQESGFVVIFKEHSTMHASKKKGNVDTLMVFTIMRAMLERADSFEKVLLITGDGDFYELVKYLIEKDKFVKILHPAKRNASSLYKSLGSEHFDYLENDNVKSLIEYSQKR